MSLSKPAIDAALLERRAQELLNEWLRGYFDGAPHPVGGAEREFPLVELLFNQAELPPGDDVKPQLHVTFIDMESSEEWWRGGDLGTWHTVLARPAAGVSYGATTDGAVVESVHGKTRRTFAGRSDIRWVASGADLLEQTYGSGWGTVRTIPNATSLRWIRDGDDYVEQSMNASTPTELRRITPTEAFWDGAQKRLTAKLLVGWWIRCTHAGSGPRKEWLARDTAAAIEALVRDPQALAALGEKGMRNWSIMHSSRPMTTSGAAVRYLATQCSLECFVRREHVT